MKLRLTQRRIAVPILVLAFVTLLTSTALAAGTVTGRIFSEAAPYLLEGVAVSNGEQVVLTDHQGRYELSIDDDFALIHVSVPSGYRPVDERWFDRVYVEGEVRLDFVLAPEEQPDTWSFIHITDVHIRPENAEFVAGFPRYVNALDDPRPALVANTGDLIHDLRSIEGYDGIREGFAMYTDAMDGLEVPLRNVIGNHEHAGYRTDMNPDSCLFSAGSYERLLGPRSYSYNYGGMRLIALDNTRVNIPVDGGYHSAISDRCMRWLAADLAVTDEQKPILLLMHQPPGNIRNGEELFDLLAGRTIHGIFYGHRHTVDEYEYEGIPAFRSGSLTRPGGGAARGYRLVTVGPDGIIETSYRSLEDTGE